MQTLILVVELNCQWHSSAFLYLTLSVFYTINGCMQWMDSVIFFEWPCTWYSHHVPCRMWTTLPGAVSLQKTERADWWLTYLFFLLLQSFPVTLTLYTTHCTVWHYSTIHCALFTLSTPFVVPLVSCVQCIAKVLHVWLFLFLVQCVMITMAVCHWNPTVKM